MPFTFNCLEKIYLPVMHSSLRTITIYVTLYFRTYLMMYIRISYETTEKCSAIQWLTPNQTVGKKHPYLFTQCQAIHARSLVPCQDSPAIKITYSAKVSCPAPLVALMSALKTSESTGAESTMNVYEFEQKTTMPVRFFVILEGCFIRSVYIKSR